MVAAERFQERAVHEVVVNQVGRSGDPYRDLPLRKFGDQIAEDCRPV